MQDQPTAIELVDIVAEFIRDLCARIEAGELTLETPGLADHLWAITMTKLAIDQPKYSGYVRALEEEGRR